MCARKISNFFFLELIKSVISRMCSLLSISIHQAVQSSVVSGLNLCDCLLTRFHAHHGLFFFFFSLNQSVLSRVSQVIVLKYLNTLFPFWTFLGASTVSVDCLSWISTLKHLIPSILGTQSSLDFYLANFFSL